MKNKYPPLKKGCKCNTCYGCNRLEQLDFTGVYRCENYKEAKDEQIQKQESRS